MFHVEHFEHLTIGDINVSREAFIRSRCDIIGVHNNTSMLITLEEGLHGGTAFIDIKALLEHLGVKQGSIIADLGCGGGGHFVLTSARTVGLTGLVYALDVQKRVLKVVEEQAKAEKLENIQFIWSNLENYGAAPIPNESCDIAFLVNVLFQNKDYATILRDSLRFVRPGGLLAVIDWRHGAVNAQFGPPMELRVNQALVREIASAQGGVVIDEFAAGPYHYAMTIKK